MRPFHVWVTTGIITALLALPTSAPTAAAAAPRCGDLTATIVGTPGQDRLSGTAASDVIVGLGGDDHIDGRAATTPSAAAMAATP